MNRRKAGLAIICAAVILVLFLFYYNSQKRQVPVVFSPSVMLSDLWQKYKNQYIDPSSHKTVDRQQNNITTSEAESYTMLRAVWEDDRITFDNSWNWTKQNLQRPDDHLFSWLYGKRADGSYGILSEKGG